MPLRQSVFRLAIIPLFMLPVHPLFAKDLSHPDLFASNPYSQGIREPAEVDNISFRHLPEDLGRNFRSLLTENNLAPIVFGAGLTGLASFLDENEFDGEGDVLVSPHGSSEGSSLGRLGERMGHHYLVSGVIAGIAVTGQIANNPRFERFSYSLVQGYMVEGNRFHRGLPARQQGGQENHQP